MGNITDTVKTLIILNVIFFVGSMLLSPGTAESLFIMYFPASPNFKVWQPLTHMFMHGSISHIFFNMFNLFMFGSILERSLGANKFLFLYFSAGFGALALHLTIDYSEFIPILSKIIESGYSKDQAIELMAQNRMLPGGMLGASGAVSGLFMAFAVIYPNLPLQIMFIPVPIKAKYLVGGYFLMDLYFAITGKSMFSGVSIAHWAHVGGAIVGFIIIWYWKKNSFNEKRWY